MDEVLILDEKGQVVDEGKTELKQYSEFKRVNFNEPSTVVSYGSELINQINPLVQSITSMSNKEESVDIEFDRKVKDIPNYANALEQREDERNKKALAISKKVNAKGIEAFINRIFKRNEDQNVPTYFDLHQTYMNDIDYISSAIDKKKENILLDNQVKTAFAHKLEGYMIKLQALIDAGNEDKQTYLSTTIKELEEKAKSTNDPATLQELAYKKKVVEIFEKRLLSLEKHLAVMNASKQQISMQQAVNFNLLVEYDDFVSSTVSSLKVQGTVMIGTIKQKQALTEMHNLADSTNQAMTANSQIIGENIESANDLSARGTIHIETLQELYQNIEKGISLYNEGVKAAKEQREQESRILTEMASQVERLKVEQPIDLPEGVMDSFNNNYKRTYKLTQRNSRG